MSARRLFLVLAPAVQAACTGGAVNAIGATSGTTTHKRDRRDPFIGMAPVDMHVAAAAAIAAVGATQDACKSYTVSCGGLTSARASSIWTSRGGATQQGPGPNDYASTLDDQSRPWWTEDKTHPIHPVLPNKKRGFFNPLRRDAITDTKKNISTWTKTVQDSLPEIKAHVSEYISDGGWILLTALPAALFGAKAAGSGGGKGVDQDGGESRPPKAKALGHAASKVGPVKPPMAARVKSSPTKIRATKKGSIRTRTTRGRGGVDVVSASSLARALVPDNAYARAVGVVALAALGIGGLHALESNGLLRAAWPITFVEPWQVLTALAWAGNIRVTLIGGRLDGSSQAEPSIARPVEFFTPASWAFTIWAPIFLGEMLFALYQLLPLPSIRGAWWLSDISPWFCGAMLLQSLWCASFRPWARDAGLLWLPALLLGGVAVALGGVHRILREAWFAGDIEIPQYLVAHLPLSLHFGWITCASLVNLNGHFASVTSLSNRAKLFLSLCSIFAAVVHGVGITLVREDPVYAGVVAWALWAVGSEEGWRNLKGRVDPGAIRVQEIAAKAGSMLALAAAGVPLGISLKDAIMGGDVGYKEDY